MSAGKFLNSRERIELGQDGERAAALYLQDQGYTLLEQNYRSRQGEADLILLDGETLVFCEVKTKRLLKTGHAAEGYGKKQQARLRKLVLRYLQKSRWEGPLRIDVVALQRSPEGPHYEVHHYKNALNFEDNW